MAFGQSAGPPASARQIDELAALFERAGFTSFREARHPFGLTQRQAAGKFTGAEASELIERLTAAETVQQAVDADPGSVVSEPSSDAVPSVAARPRTRSAASLEAERRREERRAQALASLSDEAIAAELEQRGWCCIPPPRDGG